MRPRSIPTMNQCMALVVIALIGPTLASRLLAQQLPPGAGNKIIQQRQLLAIRPVKVSVRVLAESITVGTRPPVQVTLLNADDQPVPTAEDWQCEVSFRFPSGRSVSQTVSIKKGESTAQLEFYAEQAGLTSISVRPLTGSARPDKTDVIVLPKNKLSKRKQPQARLHVSPRYTYTIVALNGDGDLSARLRTVRLELTSEGSSSRQDPESHGQVAANIPVLHISVNDTGGNYIANGKDAAKISAIFYSPDGSPAPTDIDIWFHRTNGLLNPPQPLHIAKGSFKAEADLTSVWPAEIQVNFVNSTPRYQAEGDTDFTLHFVPPGVVLLGPTNLSVVDNAPVMVVFFDAQNNPVAPGKNWKVTLHSQQSKFRFAPQSFEVQPTSPTGSAVLFPVSFGADKVEAVMANYNPQPLPIVITGWLVLGLCLAGGVAGGLVAYNKFKGSWLWRIFLGILGGAVLCWLYVYLALPNVDVNIAHNTFSVFFVALIGGYMGITVLDFAAKRLGISL